MNQNDRTLVRTAADLERKYNFAKLLGLTANVETNNKNLIKLENELNNMLNSLIINLGDILDSQTNISLWFYSGTPTTSNLPYSSWTTPSDHIGDLYYNQSNGYVYKYINNQWERQTDENLVMSMALTNSQIDVENDHERVVNFSQPTIPYSNGDWWILEDGTLKICQITKTSGEFSNDDFIVGNKYVPTIASQDGDIITIKQGQVVKLSDTFATFTDLATGGTTIIDGANISTGAIASSNYVNATSGSKLDLENGNLDVNGKNLSIDDNGLYLATNHVRGTALVNADGVLNTMVFNSSQFAECNVSSWGFSNLLMLNSSASGYLVIGNFPDTSKGIANQYDNIVCGAGFNIYIPENFKVTNAFLVVKKASFYFKDSLISLDGDANIGTMYFYKVNSAPFVHYEGASDAGGSGGAISSKSNSWGSPDNNGILDITTNLQALTKGTSHSFALLGTSTQKSLSNLGLCQADIYVMGYYKP